MVGNPYLAGSFAPVTQEHTVTELAVTGRIPEHLDGRYVRAGPNPVGEIDPASYHWFTGDGMVHGVRIRDGRAEWYRNRWVRSPAAALALGERPPAQQPGAGVRGLGANTHVVAHAGRTLALVEGGFAIAELSDELDTVGPCSFDGTITGGFTAHPKHDPESGELHAVSYHFGRAGTVQYSVIGVDGRARRTVDIDVHGSPMMHDMALTKDHVLVLDLPVTFDADRGARLMAPAWLRAPTRMALAALIGRVRVPDPLMALAAGGDRSRNGDFPYSWDPARPARVGVLPREGGSDDVRWFEVSPCFVFHVLGAYDDGPRVVCDVVRYERMFVGDAHGPGGSVPTLHRWTFDLHSGTVTEDTLDDHPQEFPRIDERRLGRRHRYGYGMEIEDGLDVGAVLRHDLEQGRTTRRRLGPSSTGSELVFVPAGAASDEGDGVLMGYVHDRDTGRSRLTVLDAATLETVADVHLPVRVPQGFHGSWLPAA